MKKIQAIYLVCTFGCLCPLVSITVGLNFIDRRIPFFHYFLTNDQKGIFFGFLLILVTAVSIFVLPILIVLFVSYFLNTVKNIGKMIYCLAKRLFFGKPSIGFKGYSESFQNFASVIIVLVMINVCLSGFLYSMSEDWNKILTRNFEVYHFWSIDFPLVLVGVLFILSLPLFERTTLAVVNGSNVSEVCQIAGFILVPCNYGEDFRYAESVANTQLRHNQVDKPIRSHVIYFKECLIAVVNCNLIMFYATFRDLYERIR